MNRRNVYLFAELFDDGIGPEEMEIIGEYGLYDDDVESRVAGAVNDCMAMRDLYGGRSGGDDVVEFLAGMEL